MFVPHLIALDVDRCFTVESFYYSFALVLVVVGSVEFVISVFTFLSMLEIFFYIFAIFSLICLCLSSPSSFIFSMVVSIP